jgi:hypothetical protein
VVFTKHLREGIRRGRIKCSIRIWKRCHVKVGGRYQMDEGHIVVDSIAPMTLTDIISRANRVSAQWRSCSRRPSTVAATTYT